MNEITHYTPPTTEELIDKLSSASLKEESKDAEEALRNALEAKFRAQLKISAEEGGYNVQSATGLVEHEGRIYKVQLNTPAHNPLRQIRRKLGLTSGRQWKKFRKIWKLKEEPLTEAQRKQLAAEAEAELNASNQQPAEQV